MKYLYLIILSAVAGLNSYSQTTKNTSYLNQSGEKVLRLECELPVDISTAWKFFTEDSKIRLWMAPLAHIELKSGGYIVTNYDTTKILSDSSSIILPIFSFVEKELLVLKVNLNDSFPKSTRDTDDNLQEIIQFIKLDDKRTKIISSVTGWGNGSDWDKVYSFFEQGNSWTYNELLKNFE